MKKWKYCVNAGFFGKRRDRFTEYQPDRTLEEKFGLISGSVFSRTGLSC